MTQLWTQTGYNPRNSQNPNNPMYPGSQLDLPPYSGGNEVTYLGGDGDGRYSTSSPLYPSYPTPFIPSQNGAGPLIYMQPTPGSAPMPYHMQPLPNPTVPSQARSVTHHPFYASSVPSHHFAHQQPRLPLAPEISLTDTEDQESPNYETMRSESISPTLDGYPNVVDFDELMKQYVQNLSPKKQDKALIHAKRAANIKAVLIDKKTTTVESAQFRFWVKKMFTLEPKDPSIPARRKKICHEGKPVAIREKLFKILTRAHKQCQHGGRDKTSAQVRRVYSWVPKELISRFVKLCPTCQVRRGTSRNSPPLSEHSPRSRTDAHSPDLNCTDPCRRQSIATRMASKAQSPLQMARFSATFQQQNRWMTPLPDEKLHTRIPTLGISMSPMVNMDMNSSLVSNNNLTTDSKYAESPRAPYLPRTMQGGPIGSHGSQSAFHDMHDVQEPPCDSQAYRFHQGTTVKDEYRF